MGIYRCNSATPTGTASDEILKRSCGLCWCINRSLSDLLLCVSIYGPTIRNNSLPCIDRTHPTTPYRQSIYRMASSKGWRIPRQYTKPCFCALGGIQCSSNDLLYFHASAMRSEKNQGELSPADGFSGFCSLLYSLPLVEIPFLSAGTTSALKCLIGYSPGSDSRG